MWQASFDLPDTKNDTLRALIATIEAQLKALDRPLVDGQTEDPLKAAWAQLVTELGIGPETASRACPHCKRLSRIGASACAYCWASLRSD
jgi:hypothetical protein